MAMWIVLLFGSNNAKMRTLDLPADAQNPKLKSFPSMIKQNLFSLPPKKRLTAIINECFYALRNRKYPVPMLIA